MYPRNMVYFRYVFVNTFVDVKTNNNNNNNNNNKLGLQIRVIGPLYESCTELPVRIYQFFVVVSNRLHLLLSVPFM